MRNGLAVTGNTPAGPTCRSRIRVATRRGCWPFPPPARTSRGWSRARSGARARHARSRGWMRGPKWTTTSRNGITAATRVYASEIAGRAPRVDALFCDGCPGGESPARWPRAAVRVIARVRAMNGDVALVGHGHVFRVLTARWLGLPGRRGPVPARPRIGQRPRPPPRNACHLSAGTRRSVCERPRRIRRTPPADDRTESAEPALTQAARLHVPPRGYDLCLGLPPAEPSPTRRIAFLSLSLERVTPAPNRVSQPASNEGSLTIRNRKRVTGKNITYCLEIPRSRQVG